VNVQIAVVVVVVHVTLDVDVDAAQRIDDLLRPDRIDRYRRVDVRPGEFSDQAGGERRTAEAVRRVQLLVPMPRDRNPGVAWDGDERRDAPVQVNVRQNDRVRVALVFLRTEDDEIEAPLVERRRDVALRYLKQNALRERFAGFAEHQEPDRERSDNGTQDERNSEDRRSGTWRIELFSLL
jgi:hypothetical protein